MAKQSVWSLYAEDEDGQQSAQHFYDNPRDAAAVAQRASRKSANRTGNREEHLKLGKNAKMYTSSGKYDPKYVVTKQDVKHFAFRGPK